MKKEKESFPLLFFWRVRLFNTEKCLILKYEYDLQGEVILKLLAIISWLVKNRISSYKHTS